MLSQLEVLELKGTKITDTGLEHLKGLKRLQILSLFQTKVTDAGIERLQKALPKARIEYSIRKE